MGRPRKSLIAAGVLVAVLGPGTLHGSAHPVPGAGVSSRVDSSPPGSALRKGIRIHSSRRAAERDPRILYSVRLRHPRKRERITVVGAAAPSYCSGGDIKHDRKSSPCRRLEGKHHPRPDYPVRIRVLLYRARSASEPSRPATAPLPGGTASNTCTLARHHCPLTARSTTTLKRGAGQYVNLAVIAWTPSRRWHGGGRLAVDCVKVAGVCDTVPTNTSVRNGAGRMLQSGQLGVVRLGSHRGPRVRVTSDRVDDRRLVVNDGDYKVRTVVHSARLDGLVAGDVISTSGTVDITGHGFDHFAGSYWVLATGPNKTLAAPASPERYLSGRNGVNCLGAHARLTGRTSGYCSASRPPATLPVKQVAIGAVPRGAPSTMYLNYVVLVSDGSRPAGVTSRAHVDGGRFRIDCYSAQRAARAEPCSIPTP